MLAIDVLNLRVGTNTKGIMALLLAYGADVNIIQINNDLTAFTFARERNIQDFDKFAKDYSPDGSLKKLCIKCILTHQELFDHKLDILPQELRDLFKF